MLRRLATCWLVVAVLASIPLAAMAAETAFPFGSELLLDGKPMRGTKRLPSLSIEEDGTAAIDLWCGSLRPRRRRQRHHRHHAGRARQRAVHG
jgi:hypothetical protein